MSPSGFQSEISISIGLDLQDAYDQARAMAKVFRSQLIALEEPRPAIVCESCGEVGHLSVSIDIGDARQKARALAQAWDAAAMSLEQSGFVCLHPESRRIQVDDAMDICLECERAVHKGDGSGYRADL